MKRLLPLGAVLAVLAGAPAAGRAGPPFASCGDNGLVCATLSVPLDYANPAAGQVPLYVEELPAVGKPRGVMVMLAGGPGQASAETFNLGLKAAYWRAFFPGYTLVAYDDRGTGKSGALDCPRAPTIAACGSAITTRAYYTTPEHGEDIESVRLALGVDKVAVWGVSYGTKHAVAYALAHPTHVERLLLDSEVLPDKDTIDPLSLRVVPASVNGICANNPCAGITSGAGDRLVQLANQLQAHPVTASISFGPTLAPFQVTLDGQALLSLAYESDLSSAVSSQLPGGDRRRAGRLDAAARAACVPRPGQQHAPRRATSTSSSS